MLIWINGTFGVGKTTLAQRLAEHWPDAVLADPELVGTTLMTWGGRHGLGVPDFQDLPLWRELVLTALTGFHAEVGRPMIVPMTLLNPAYFAQIVGGLRDAGIDVRHFCLVAPRDEILRRLGEREVPDGMAEADAWTWATERLDRYLPAASDPRFETFLDATRSRDDLLADLLTHLPAPLPATT